MGKAFCSNNRYNVFTTIEELYVVLSHVALVVGHCERRARQLREECFSETRCDKLLTRNMLAISKGTLVDIQV